MKTPLILCVLSFFGLSLAASTFHPRGCIYIEGDCERECEVGTHSVTTGCGYVEPEPTCDNPTPTTDTSDIICDFTDCYCDPPTVRDKVTGKCVPLDKCPKKTISN